MQAHELLLPVSCKPAVFCLQPSLNLSRAKQQRTKFDQLEKQCVQLFDHEDNSQLINSLITSKLRFLLTICESFISSNVPSLPQITHYLSPPKKQEPIECATVLQYSKRPWHKKLSLNLLFPNIISRLWNPLLITEILKDGDMFLLLNHFK